MLFGEGGSGGFPRGVKGGAQDSGDGIIALVAGVKIIGDVDAGARFAVGEIQGWIDIDIADAFFRLRDFLEEVELVD